MDLSRWEKHTKKRAARVEYTPGRVYGLGSRGPGEAAIQERIEAEVAETLGAYHDAVARRAETMRGATSAAVRVEASELGLLKSTRDTTYKAIVDDPSDPSFAPFTITAKSQEALATLMLGRGFRAYRKGDTLDEIASSTLAKQFGKALKGPITMTVATKISPVRGVRIRAAEYTFDPLAKSGLGKLIRGSLL